MACRRCRARKVRCVMGVGGKCKKCSEDHVDCVMTQATKETRDAQGRSKRPSSEPSEYLESLAEGNDVLARNKRLFQGEVRMEVGQDVDDISAPVNRRVQLNQTCFHPEVTHLCATAEPEHDMSAKKDPLKGKEKEKSTLPNPGGSLPASISHLLQRVERNGRGDRRLVPALHARDANFSHGSSPPTSKPYRLWQSGCHDSNSNSPIASVPQVVVPYKGPRQQTAMPLSEDPNEPGRPTETAYSVSRQLDPQMARIEPSMTRTSAARQSQSITEIREGNGEGVQTQSPGANAGRTIPVRNELVRPLLRVRLANSDMGGYKSLDFQIAQLSSTAFVEHVIGAWSLLPTQVLAIEMTCMWQIPSPFDLGCRTVFDNPDDFKRMKATVLYDLLNKPNLGEERQIVSIVLHTKPGTVNTQASVGVTAGPVARPITGPMTGPTAGPSVGPSARPNSTANAGMNLASNPHQISQ